MLKSSLTLPKDIILKLQNVRTRNSLKRRVGDNNYLFSTNSVSETMLMLYHDYHSILLHEGNLVLPSHFAKWETGILRKER